MYRPRPGPAAVHGALWQSVSLQAMCAVSSKTPGVQPPGPSGHPVGYTLEVVSVLLPKDHSKGQLPRSPWPWCFLGGMRGSPS